jgi:hypothetical protein
MTESQGVDENEAGRLAHFATARLEAWRTAVDYNHWRTPVLVRWTSWKGLPVDDGTGFSLSSAGSKSNRRRNIWELSLRRMGSMVGR